VIGRFWGQECYYDFSPVMVVGWQSEVYDLQQLCH